MVILCRHSRTFIEDISEMVVKQNYRTQIYDIITYHVGNPGFLLDNDSNAGLPLVNYLSNSRSHDVKFFH